MVMNDLNWLQERRSRRSKETLKAITFQLEHVTSVHDLRNFTFSDETGLVLASSGHAEESELIAAYAPVLSNCADRERRAELIAKLSESMPELQESGLLIRSFYLDGTRYFLALVGEPGAQLDAAIYRALTGARRIYRQTLSA